MAGPEPNWVIQMFFHVSGGRADGRAWPGPWTDFEVPAEEGRHLTHPSVGQAGFIRYATSELPPAAVPEVPVVSVPAETAAGPVSRETPVTAEETPEPAGDTPAAEIPPDTGPPSPSALRADWVDYAVSRGEDQETAGRMTKADLMSRWGERL